MNKNLTVTSSPHISCPRTTAGIMLDVIIALLPAGIASVILFGYRSAIVITVTLISCVIFEWLWCKLLKKPNSIGDLSAIVTALLLAYNMPASIPLWQAVVGSFVAIVVVKQLFGGIGCNFVNPALAGRVVMAVSFASSMVNYAYPKTAPDVLSSATPLNLIETGIPDAIASVTPNSEVIAGTPNLWTLFIGNYGGVLGETSALALLLGGIYLVLRGVIKPIIPLSFIATTFVFTWAFGCPCPLASILSGGLFLGAIFMATDYTTSPYTDLGKLVFGVGCGLLTAIIRNFANSTEGISYAILIMNLLVPYINKLCRKKPFGTEVAKNA